jgi:hypothetical protein
MAMARFFRRPALTTFGAALALMTMATSVGTAGPMRGMPAQRSLQSGFPVTNFTTVTPFRVMPNFMTVPQFTTVPQFMTVPQFRVMPSSSPLVGPFMGVPRFPSTPVTFGATPPLPPGLALSSGLVGGTQAIMNANLGVTQALANSLALQNRALLMAGLGVQSPFSPFPLFGNAWMSPALNPLWGTWPWQGNGYSPNGYSSYMTANYGYPSAGTIVGGATLRTSSAYSPGTSSPAAGGGSAGASGNVQPGAGTEQAPSLPAAGGLPSQAPQLSWPLGLRILPPAPETQALRQQIDALLQSAAAQQAKNGRVNPRVVQELNATVGKLQVLLRRDDERRTLPLEVHNEAERFLKKLKDALKTLQ